MRHILQRLLRSTTARLEVAPFTQRYDDNTKSLIMALMPEKGRRNLPA
jgi:hypothetical protein